jgi:biotin transport system substrate-specific component
MAVAFLLGQKRGVSAVALYLGYGALGLPVFAGGSAGATVFLGPTGGYLVGFLLAAVVVGSVSDWLGKLGQRNHSNSYYWRSLFALSVTFLAGKLVIYATGVAHLAGFVGWQNVLRVGVVPFLVGDALKFGILLTGAAATIRKV